MIQLTGVTKTFAGVAALQPTTLTIPTGQVTALIGPSGCGKTTLLKTILGLVTPDSGAIRVGDTPVTPATVRDVRLRIGYVVQDGGLFPHLTARDNVTLMARQLRRDGIPQRTEELARLVRLPPGAIDRYPAELSGGQRQRVGLMRALMLDPPTLLLDEPMGALDPLVRVDLQADLKAIFRDLGKTVVLVTHDLTEAAVLGDQIVLMKDGVIVQSGSLADLEERPADPFVTRFLRAYRGPFA